MGENLHRQICPLNSVLAPLLSWNDNVSVGAQLAQANCPSGIISINEGNKYGDNDGIRIVAEVFSIESLEDSLDPYCLDVNGDMITKDIQIVVQTRENGPKVTRIEKKKLYNYILACVRLPSQLEQKGVRLSSSQLGKYLKKVVKMVKNH